jgi:2-haloacid dehalogenase
MTVPEGALNTVVFDLGGVLVDWNPRHLYRKLLPDEASVEAFLDEVGFAEWNGSLDAGRSWPEAIESLAARHPEHRALIEAFAERWPETLGGEIEGTAAVVRDLQATGVRLLALSNWASETFAVARGHFAVLDAFEGITISGDAGVAKPDPRIFEHFISQFGVDPVSAVYIDDMPANVAAAAALGFRAVQFTSPEALRWHLVGLGLLAG